MLNERENSKGLNNLHAQLNTTNLNNFQNPQFSNSSQGFQTTKANQTHDAFSFTSKPSSHALSTSKPPKPKDLRTFLLIWTAIFFGISVYPLLHGASFRLWAGIIAFLFLLTALLKPTLATKFYFLWVKFGEAIGNVISKVVLTILFFAVFTPIGLILRLLGKDLLFKKLDKNATTYFVKRQTQPNSMRLQY